jgi:DNA polymerase-3 subunit epsilon
MSFYLRKSVKAGPFRFNLSKSGVGVSAGVPGFRAGTGPRGNYVRVGGNGVIYRSTRQGDIGADPGWTPPLPAPVAEILLEDVTGASAAELIPNGPGDLVQQLNDAASRRRLLPWVLGLLAVVLLAQPAVGAGLLVVSSPGLVWLWFNDRSRRTVVAFYDVNDDAAGWFQGMVDATSRLAASDALWRVDASGNVQTSYQYKVNAGATTIVSRSTARASLTPPAILATNIAVPSIVSSKAALYFLPDRLLIMSGKRFSDVAYDELGADAAALRFTESGRVPRDARQVDTTWQYVNVGGGPDRRFKNNRRYPVMQYGEINLVSDGGLRWQLQCSQPPAIEGFEAILLGAPTETLKLSAEPA